MNIPTCAAKETENTETTIDEMTYADYRVNHGKLLLGKNGCTFNVRDERVFVFVDHDETGRHPSIRLHNPQSPTEMLK